jgi:PAS domain S-box-containing protein
MKANKTGRSKSDREKETVRQARVQSSSTPPIAQENEETLQNFFNVLDDLVFILDSNGRILFTNPAARKRLGYSAADLAAMHAMDMHPPEHRREAADIVAGMLTGNIASCSIPLLARDGTRIPAETRISRGKWRGKSVMFAISRDMTERKRAEEMLQESSLRMKMAVGAADMGVWHVDLTCDKVTTPQSSGPVSGLRTGKSPANLKEFLDLIHPEDRSQVARRVNEAIAGNGDYQAEFRIVRPDGTTRWVYAQGQVFYDEKDRPVAIAGMDLDITERKQAEEELFKSRQVLRMVLDTIPQRVFWKDRNSVFLGCNQPLAQDCGYTDPSRLVGKTDYETISAPTADLYRADDRQVMETGQPKLNYVEPQVKLDGSQGWLITSKMPLRDKDGQVIGVLGTYEDITSRKRMEEALRVEKERLDRASVAGNIALWEWDLATGRMEWSSFVDSMLGFEPGAFPRTLQAWEEIVHPKDRDSEERALADHLEKNTPYDVEYRVRRKDGAYVWWHDMGTCRRDKQGQAYQMSGVCIDVTQRKHAQEALRKAADQWQTTFDAVNDAVWLLDRDQRILRSNKAAETLFRRPLSEMLGRHCWEIIHGTSEPIPGCPVSRARHTLHRETLDLQIDDRWFEMTADPLFDQAGNFAGAVHIVTDITARKQAEVARKQSGDRLEKINHCLLKLGSDHDANINCLTALCGELLDASCALYNRLEGDLLCTIGAWHTPPDFKLKDAAAGHLCHDVIRANKDTAVVISDLPRTPYAESDPHVRAYGLRTYLGFAVKSEGKAVGSLCVVYRADYQPTDDDRRILGIIASAIGNEDTRHQAETELRRLMSAIEQTPESVVITDTQARILYVNPAFERITGYTRAEVTGHNPRILKSDRQDAAFYQALWKKISAGEVWHGRFINVKKDGTLYTEDAAITPVRDDQGAIVNYIAIKRDITRELQQQEQYLQSQKMDSIGRLAGGVAHDFNNILSVIMGHTELALMDLPADHPVRSQIETVRDSAERAAALTRQLLTFARRQVIEPRLLNLNDLILNLNKMLHRLIGEDIQLVTQTAPGLHLVKADPGQLEQVLLNLVVNARDAMPNGGVVIISTQNVTLDETYARQHLKVVPGDYVLISVSDTGAGISDETKQHIFEPFFTTKGPGKGTGLGLATCFGIIQQSNGHIQFDTKVGRGTTFNIYLPRGRETPALTHKGDTELIVARGTETILVVEDELSLRNLIARVLRAQGYTVLEAPNGREALVLAETRPGKIHLLLSDVVMPEMGGPVLAEHLGALCPGIKILFISGYISNTAIRDTMATPGTQFLQKPFNPAGLAKKVRQTLDTP